MEHKISDLVLMEAAGEDLEKSSQAGRTTGFQSIIQRALINRSVHPGTPNCLLGQDIGCICCYH